MGKSKVFAAAMAAVILIFVLSMPVLAHDVPDLTKEGSIRLTMHVGETAVGGGTLTLYRVGQIHEDDGNYSFAPAGDFEQCGESFENLKDPYLAENLAIYALEHEARAAATQTVDSEGKVAFENLELGLYLVVQTEPAKGYYPAAPFLVSLPYMEDGVYHYDVNASPKVELEKAPDPTQPPPTKPTDPDLPQTGQLNWPVPLLACAGLALFAGGWALCFGKRERNEA